MIFQDYECGSCGLVEVNFMWNSYKKVKNPKPCAKCGEPSHIRYQLKRDYQCSLTLGDKTFKSTKEKQDWLRRNNLMEGGDLVGGSRHYIPPGLDEPASVPHGSIEFDHMPTAKDLEAHTAKIMQRIAQGDRQYHVKETMRS